jgi:hypothetical protein
MSDETLFRAGEFYVIQAEEFEYAAFDGVCYLVLGEDDELFGEFETQDEAEEYAVELFDRMINPEDYDD